MKSYFIRPDDGVFSRLTENMKPTEEERLFLSSVKVDYVEILPEKKQWKIILSENTSVSENFLIKVAAHMKKTSAMGLLYTD